MTTSGDGAVDPRPDGLRLEEAGVEPAGIQRASISLLARSAGIYLVFSLVVSLLALAVLEITSLGWDWPHHRELLTVRPGVAGVTALILLLSVVSLLAATGHMWVTATFVLGLVTLLGVSSRLKFEARREPVYPRDLPFLREPAFLLQMVEQRMLWLALPATLGLAAFTWALSKMFRMWLRRRPVAQRTRRQRVTVLALRATVAGVILLLLLPLLDFNRPANPWRLAYEYAGAHWREVSQAYNYRTNGFVGGFLFNLATPAMVKPAGYSRATMERIVEKYVDAADRVNEKRPSSALDDVNVIMVLSESLSDPTRFEGVELAEDPLPRVRELMEQLPHGFTLSPKIGGGTSSMEFEALTGMSLSQFDPTMDVPYQMLVPEHEYFPSSVELFNQLGHTTLAIHPNPGTLYQRNRTYPILGFSDFIELSEMQYRFKAERHLSSAFVADAAAYREVLDSIENNAAPLFVNLVTMQNHTPYTDKYEDPLDVSGLSRHDAAMVGQYSRGLTYTDRATKRFLQEISSSEEKTLVVLYGDHLPAGLPQTLFEQNSGRMMHEAPFFVYSNFKELEAERLPTTSPIFFLPKAFDMVGAPLPPYFALLRELEEHVSAMQHGIIIDPADREISPAEISDEARDVLRDYRLVQYDLSVGQRYAEQMLRLGDDGAVQASGSTE